MINQCTEQVQALVDKNVMLSRTTPFFTLNQDIFGRCIDSGSNYFNEFCLYPPTQDLLSMCKDPDHYEPSFLFSRMLDFQLRSVAELPNVIQYVRFAGDGDWSPQPQLTPVTFPAIVLNESFTAHNEWFVGTTTVPASSLPNPIPADVSLVRSQHQLLQIVFRGNTQKFELEFANIPNMILQHQDRIIRLYDSGNLRIFDSHAHADADAEMWQSGTNDQYGSDAIFSQLEYPLQSIAPGALATLQSRNGAYLLVVTDNLVSIKYQAFNNARFTSSTLNTGTIQQAIDAQSQFCFQAMNQNQTSRDLLFVDPRCNCLASDRLVDRVYDPSSFDTLPDLMQFFLKDTTPCLMRKCQLMPGEFTNANIHLTDKCVSANGFCESMFPQNNNPTLLSVNDCLVNLSPCVTSTDCPLGSSCRNRQCTLNCTSDIPCIRANPLASCVNGECKLSSSLSSSQRNLGLWVAVAFAVCVVVVLLALIIYFVNRRTK